MHVRTPGAAVPAFRDLKQIPGPLNPIAMAGLQGRGEPPGVLQAQLHPRAAGAAVPAHIRGGVRAGGGGGAAGPRLPQVGAHDGGGGGHLGALLPQLGVCVLSCAALSCAVLRYVLWHTEQNSTQVLKTDISLVNLFVLQTQNILLKVLDYILVKALCMDGSYIITVL